MMKFQKTIVFVVLFMASFSHAFTGGDGTVGNPYQISTRADLEAVNTNLSANYILMNDIDLAGTEFTQSLIAPGISVYDEFQGERFTGTFDGNCFKIKNLTLKATTSMQCVGTFGAIGQQGTVKNLNIENITIRDDSSKACFAGGLAGHNYGNIDRCSSSGSVSSRSAGAQWRAGAGGMVCYNKGIITNSFTNGTINAYGSGSFAGGFFSDNWGSVSMCYAACDVNSEFMAGGFCSNNSDSGIVSNSYAMGNVFGHSYVGGFCGNNSDGIITRCFSTASVIGRTNDYVCGFVGRNMEATIRNSIWNTETSGKTIGYININGTFPPAIAENIIGQTTAEMKTIEPYLALGWDFVGEDDNGVADVWYMEPGGYPRLNGVGGDGSGVAVEGLIVSAIRRVGRAAFEYDVAVKVRNGGADLESAELRLVGYPANVRVLNAGPAAAGAMAAGAQAICGGMLTLRIDREAATDTGKITWHATRHDAIGGQYIEIITSDINLTTFGADGIGHAELYEIANNWLLAGLADVNYDGIVNYEDMSILTGLTR